VCNPALAWLARQDALHSPCPHTSFAAAGGWLSQWHGAAAVFGFGLVLTAIWLAVSATMSAPPAFKQGNYSMGET
jgi:hypothetical protein